MHRDERFEKLLPFQIGGLETAATPLLVAITLTGAQRGISVNAFIVRKERKATGVGKRIEGRVGAVGFNDHQRVISVDEDLSCWPI